MKTLRVIVVALLAVGCATNPATGRRQLILMSEAEEIQIGKQGDAEVRQQMGLYKDQALQRYVNEVGQRLAKSSQRPNLPWTFGVVGACQGLVGCDRGRPCRRRGKQNPQPHDDHPGNHQPGRGDAREDAGLPEGESGAGNEDEVAEEVEVDETHLQSRGWRAGLPRLRG